MINTLHTIPYHTYLLAIIGGSIAVVILVGTIALIFVCLSVLLLRRHGHCYCVKNEEVEKVSILIQEQSCVICMCEAMHSLTSLHA